MVVHGCAWLWMVVDGCKWLQMVVYIFIQLLVSSPQRKKAYMTSKIIIILWQFNNYFSDIY